MVIDSGTKHNILDGDAWQKLKDQKTTVTNQRTTTDKQFKSYGGHALTFVGLFEAKIQTGNKEIKGDFYVVRDYGKILIGWETAMALGVLKINDVNKVDEKGPMGKIKDVVVEIPTKMDTKPVVQGYRRIPLALETAVEKKIEELLKRDIIEPVNKPSKWVSPMVAIPKGEYVRICIDMRRANEAVERENHPLPTMEDFLPYIGKGKVFSKLDIESAYHQVDK